MLALGGCGRASDQAAVGAVAERFYAAAATHEGAQACTLLSSDARQALEQQATQPCARAVEQLKLSGRSAGTVELYTTNAAVRLRGGDIVYLERTRDGWRVSSAGCRGAGYDQPADCELQS